jgi:hypothetical protein
MTRTSSPWSREASSSAAVPPPPHAGPTLPPAPSPQPPAGAAGSPWLRPPQPGRRRWGWVVLALLLVVGVSAAVGSTVTYLAMHTARAASMPSSQTGSAPPAPATPQFSTAEVTAAKQHLCQVFDVSVRGQEGQGGLREQGNLNLPMVLRVVNSAAAVQNAVGPATPPDVASAARKYISATLDQSTAAMGSTPTPEVNRLADARNDAIYALIDACGLPR